MKFRGKNGQSTIEYLVILAVVILAIIVAATKAFQPKLRSILNRASQKPITMLSGNKMLPKPPVGL